MKLPEEAMIVGELFNKEYDVIEVPNDIWDEVVVLIVVLA